MKELTLHYTKGVGTDQEFVGTVVMNIPEDIHEMINLWGEKVPYEKALAKIMDEARRLCRTADSEEEAQELMNNWSPTTGIQRRSSGISKKAILSFFEGKSKEEIVKMLKMLGKED